MIRKAMAEHASTIIEAVLTLALFALLFLTMAQSPSVYVIAVSFCITVCLFIYLTVRARLRMKKMVSRMADEIANLPQDMSEKNYDHIQDETRLFYEELTRVRRLLRKRRQNRQELLDIANTVAANMEFSKLLQDLMPLINDATRSSCSAFYTANPSSHKLEIKHSVGFSKNIYGEFDLNLGEGLVGRASMGRDITVYRDIPEDTIYFVRTFLGKIKPRSLMVVPIVTQDQLTGVLVCASIYDYTQEDREMVELIKHYLGVAVSNGENYEKTKRLTNELTFQNKLIQDQHEEMKKRLNSKTQLLNYLVNYQSNDCLYAVDTKGAVLFWNRGAERLLGITGHAATGKLIDRLYEERQWPPLRKQMQEALRNGIHTECFWRTGPAGEHLRYEMTLTRMRDEPNEVIGVLVWIKEVAD